MTKPFKTDLKDPSLTQSDSPLEAAAHNMPGFVSIEPPPGLVEQLAEVMKEYGLPADAANAMILARDPHSVEEVLPDGSKAQFNPDKMGRDLAHSTRCESPDSAAELFQKFVMDNFQREPTGREISDYLTGWYIGNLHIIARAIEAVITALPTFDDVNDLMSDFSTVAMKYKERAEQAIDDDDDDAAADVADVPL